MIATPTTVLLFAPTSILSTPIKFVSRVVVAPSTVKLLLDIVKDPVISWTSDKALPNVVPPVAVRTPPIPTSSVTVKSSVTCKSENLPLRPKILPKEPVDDSEPLINGTVPSTILLADISFLVTLVEKLLESIFKASIDDVIASILAVACVILTLNDPLSTFKALIEDVIELILAVACVILV